MRIIFSRNISLRRKLFATLAVSLLLVWTIVAWVAFDKGVHEAEELMDGQLALSARLLDGQINHEENYHSDFWYPNRNAGINLFNPALIENLEPGGRVAYEQELAFQIWSATGILKLRSSNAIDMKPITQPGFYFQEFNQQLWRIYVKKSRDDHYLIQVAHPESDRDQIGLDIARRVLIPVFLALPFMLVVMGWAVNQSLKPLNETARSLTRRTSNELDDVPLDGLPKELSPIIEAFNVLLDRVRLSIQNERRFTSNAAHELRTPLAGIKLYSQLAQAATDPVDRAKFIGQVLYGIARAERLVEQMLRLARLDPESHILTNEVSNVDVRTLLLEVQDAEAIHLKEKQQKMELVLPDQSEMIKSDEDLLLIALSNLVSNASKFAPERTVIVAGFWKDRASFGLFVQDQGPGINPEELSTITHRFKRGRDVTAEGSGLGLAIVERIATILGASLQIENIPSGGLRTALFWKK